MSALKISKSHVERATEFKPHLRRYADRLTAMDKDGNGELDLLEVCEVLEEMATIEKQKRLLKWMSIISGIFALLSIAAIVGLTYAVVDLSKDTNFKPDSSLLYSKATDTPVSIANAVGTAEYIDLLSMSLPELRAVQTITIPEGEAFVVYHVASIASVENATATVTTTSGKVFEFDQEGVHAVNATSGSRRRLLAGTISGNIGPISFEINGELNGSFGIQISYDKSWYDFSGYDEVTTVQVIPSNTIYEVKLKYDADTSAYDLYWNGNKLSDSATIKSLGIKAGNALEYRERD